MGTKVSGKTNSKIYQRFILPPIYTYTNRIMLIPHRKIFSKFEKNNYDSSGYYTIALTEYSDDYMVTIRKILANCWSVYVTNVNVLVPTQDYETVLMYTYFPFTSEKCEGVEPVLSDRFTNDAFQLKAEIFPEKFRNFFKCPLRVALYSLPPFMILKRNPDNSYHIDGIEGRLLKSMAKQLNFTIVVSVALDNHISDKSMPNVLKSRTLNMVNICTLFSIVQSFWHHIELKTFSPMIR